MRVEKNILPDKLIKKQADFALQNPPVKSFNLVPSKIPVDFPLGNISPE